MDALDEADIDLGRRDRRRADEPKEIKVRCKGCRALNDEDAKFCDNCGKPL